MKRIFTAGCFMAMIILMQACNNGKDECSFRYIDPQKKVFNVKGCMKDSLEDGLWTIYDSAKNVVEQGNFEKGIRTGKWSYPARRSADSVVEWKRYNSSRLDITTNIPAHFVAQKDSGNILTWQASDTAAPAGIEISVLQQGDSIVLDSFYLVNEEDYRNRGWFLTRMTSKVTFKDKPYYISSYEVADAADKMFQVLNCYGMATGNRVINITVIFDQSKSEFASSVFGSILSNFFIGTNRFIDPFNEIHKVINVQPEAVTADTTRAN